MGGDRPAWPLCSFGERGGIMFPMRDMRWVCCFDMVRRLRKGYGVEPLRFQRSSRKRKHSLVRGIVASAINLISIE